MGKNTSDIYAALQAGADDDAVDAIIRAMLSTSRWTADDHAVASWRRDNYLDLRRWASPGPMEYAAAQARIAAGGAMAVEGQADLQTIFQRVLDAEFRFPSNPYVPEPDPIPPVEL